MSTGRVQSVDLHVLGGEVEGDAPAGSTEVFLVDAADLDDAGGQMLLGSGDVVTYLDVEPDTGQVFLAVPLAAPLATGDRVDVHPTATVLRATVRVDEGGVVTAAVPHTLRAMLAEGVRDVEENAEAVRLERVGASWKVADVLGEAPEWVWGDPNGARVTISEADGVQVYTVGPNGQAYRGTQLSANEVSLAVMGQDGTRLGGVDPLGNVTGQLISAAKSLSIGGIDLGGQLLGGAEPGVLDLLPRGVVPGGLVRTTTSTPVKSAGMESAYLRTTVTLHPGRQYRIVGDINVNPGAVDCAFSARMRVTTDGSIPGNTATLLRSANSGKATAGGDYLNQRVEAYWQVSVLTVARFRLSFMGINAAVAGRDANLVVEDLGPVGYDLGALEDGVEQVLYRATWNATASRMYDKTGATKAGRDGDIDPFFVVYGTADDRDSAAVLFGGGAFDTTDVIESNKTIPQALAGATIRKVEIYLHNSVWARDDWSQPKGSITVAPLGATALPATLLPDGVRWVPDIPAGQGVWFEVPVAWFANGNLGVTIGDKDAGALNGAGVLTGLDSGVFHGPADPNPPQVRITYSR